MTRLVLLRPEAEADLADAYAYYTERAPGLGEEFLRAVDAALAAVERHPEAYPLMHRSVRRALLRRFPYGLFYVLEPNRIVVLACLHARRDPKRWPGRT